ncbi:lysozyme inhibitor LprI family protein [Azorhizobium doebereinerae]|uniref:lysozyme inhibitor LprI family protein n=1 Tax=Azorhizobium doebereinerae TaxID=281091 RepID=UPI0004229A0F|nr:lysozyme inhibitor LprI family protein [Azorhizobium doebereinerae]
MSFPAAPLSAGRRRPAAPRARAGAAALLAGLLALGLSTAHAAADGPSFDCKAARTKVEKAICADPALAALDRRIAAAYQKVMGALDADGKAALRADQRIFVEARDVQARTEDYDLKADLDGRARLLEGVETTPRAGFAGTWANVFGEVTVAPAPGGGFKVEISTVQPHPSYPVCQLEATGALSGAVLVVGGSEAERKENDGWTVRLTRTGALLAAELERPKQADFASPPFCGFRATIDGSFLPMAPAPGKRAR